MSTYTTELRYLVEKKFDIGLKNYPIFKEEYREILNQKIINHYYFREIGLETAGLFAFFMNRKMFEIMNYYNQLYNSELIKIEPLTRVDMWETLVREEKEALNRHQDDIGNFTGTMNHNSGDLNVYADTPQGMLSIGDIKNNTWASSATQDDFTEDTKTNQDTTNATTIEQGIETGMNYQKHNAGNPATRTDSEMLKEWRTTFLNIDMMVINELEPLFMQIY